MGIEVPVSFMIDFACLYNNLKRLGTLGCDSASLNALTRPCRSNVGTFFFL